MLYSSLEMENEDINSLATSDVVGISHDVLGLGFGYRFPDLGTFFPHMCLSVVGGMCWEKMKSRVSVCCCHRHVLTTVHMWRLEETFQKSSLYHTEDQTQVSTFAHDALSHFVGLNSGNYFFWWCWG